MFRGEALRREIAERAVGPLGVVVLTEVFDHDPGLGEGPELLAVEAFIAEAGVERFDEAVLPRACRGDVEGLDFLLCEPALEFLGDELRSVVGADELGRAVQCDGCLNQLDDLARTDLARGEMPPATQKDRDHLVWSERYLNSV